MAEDDVIVVTGSSGFIGRALCDALAEDGYRVIAFDRPGRPHPPPSAENIACDLTSDESVSEALATVRRIAGATIASVLHLAAYYDFSGEPSPLYDDVNVRGTERLLNGLSDFEVEQFVYAGTMLVHAPCDPGQHIGEVWPLEAKWDYPASKLEAERLVHRDRDSIPAVLLRIAGVYSDRCESILLAHQIQRIYERRRTAHVFPGDTGTGQAFVHVDDLVDAFRAVVARRAELPEESAVLIGEPEAMSYDELQRTLGRLIHGEPEWETAQIPKAVAKAGAWLQDAIPGVEEPFIKPWMIDFADDHYELDITRARTLLGWEPRHALRDVLPTMIAALGPAIVSIPGLRDQGDRDI